jgi:hypothetical protein
LKAWGDLNKDKELKQKFYTDIFYSEQQNISFHCMARYLKKSI